MSSASLPELHNTIVVAAFEGWNDAGDAASDALEHLDAIWEADPIVEIDDEAYYDYQVNRPVIRQVDGVTRELVWPSMRISHCRPPGADRDIVLMHGVEPNMRWRTFCAELLAIADKLNVDTVVILGALLADTPHTRPVPVSGAAYSPESARRFGLQETRYEGPTGIAGVFQDACVAAGIPAVTFWAAVPHYVSQPPNPKATVALLRRVEDVLDIEVPLADLPAQAEEWEQAVTEMTAEDDEIAEYVQSLEQRGDAEVDMTRGAGQDRRRRAGRRVRALPAPPPAGLRALRLLQLLGVGAGGTPECGDFGVHSGQLLGSIFVGQIFAEAGGQKRLQPAEHAHPARAVHAFLAALDAGDKGRGALVYRGGLVQRPREFRQLLAECRAGRTGCRGPTRCRSRTCAPNRRRHRGARPRVAARERDARCRPWTCRRAPCPEPP